MYVFEKDVLIKMIFEIMDKISNAIMMVRSDGSIIYSNASMNTIFKSVKKDGNLVSVDDIDMKFDPGYVQEHGGERQHISLGYMEYIASVFPVNFGGKNAYIYIFEESPQNMKEFGDIINCIDDIVILTNKDGIYEFGNNAITSLLGYDPNDLIGKRSQDIVDMGISDNPIAREVLKSKKVERKLVKYSNGKTITYTAIPLFENGELNKIVLTGRDVSLLSRMVSELKEAERFKEKYYYQKEELKKYRELYRIVYASEKMDKLLNMTLRISKTDSPVFITGESGVGKEEIAKFIHRNSLRSKQPLIAINCAAIPKELLESEFFGYEEGAFTGARKGGKKGLFEEANGGTVFLDEIGELPHSMQSKLLRVIQEDKIMRLGGKKAIPIDVRYITATNLTKEKLSDNKVFRQDLYYRLSVVPIRVPALRERKDDIVPLIHHFLKYFNSKYGYNVKISNSVIQKLFQYMWPGNIRELKNIVERLVIMTNEDVIDDDEYEMVKDLDEDVRGDAQHQISISGLMDLNDAYKIVDEILIRRALQEHKTVIKAAEALGVDPSTIHRKIKKGYNFR